MTQLKDKAIQATLLGEWQDATVLNKALLSKNPKDIDALNRLAYAFTALGKIKNAKSTYKKVLQLDILNQIAIKNIKRLSELDPEQLAKNVLFAKHANSIFLEETGKTKIISLINTAQPKTIALLATGQSILISIKRSKIFIQNQNQQYLGVLPDDIGRRLIKLIKGGNVYEACIKSATEHNVSVFRKEAKRASKYKNQPSFTEASDRNFDIK
jgi:tetratricopeptide (TPR) repeat protein